ncbi:MAG: response regulator [Chloroflexaceae bacterium]|nr:response regulator [Chloroflexaceae bacterium]
MTVQHSIRVDEASILVVDDNRDDLWVLESILTEERYQVQSALNGASALAAVRATRFDIVLLDITMPDMDGYDVGRQLKADPHTHDIPIIFISALDEVRDKVKAFAIGGVDYISKPFQPEEVLARVTTHLAVHHMRQRLAAQNTSLQREVAERQRVEAELHQHREQLEALVAARTADLRTANEQLQREIGERIRAEAALRASNDTLRTLVDCSPLAIIAHDLQGQVTLWNPAAERLFGWGEAEVFQQQIPFFPMAVPPGQVPPCLDSLHSDGAFPLEVRCSRRDGSCIDISISPALLHDTEDQPARIMCIIVDITERKQAEAEREALIQELEARNTELERFTYTVSHDLKSPLVTICGFLGYLEQDAHSGNMERFKQDIQRITDAAARMQHLLDELLELSRVGRSLNPSESVPFEQVVQEAVSLVEGQLRARGVHLEISQDFPSVWGNRTRLVQAVQNLVDNAVKFMGDQPAPRIRIGWREQGTRRMFSVEDNGIGIVPAYHEKVFGLFDKLDPRSDGTGIGLALVRRIIETHGGRIWIESQGHGTGTTVYFTLPASAPSDQVGYPGYGSSSSGTTRR